MECLRVSWAIRERGTDWSEFIAIREELFLRIMDIVHESGTGFAFPSQTLYLTRDKGLNADRSEIAETQVRQPSHTNHLSSPTGHSGKPDRQEDATPTGR